MNYYAVIGNPIAHSISPRLHNAAFNALGVENIYSRALLDIIPDPTVQQKALKDLIFDLHLSGANITVPFKEVALAIAHEVDDTAAQIGSANTLIIDNDRIVANQTGTLLIRNIAMPFDAYLKHLANQKVFSKTI